MQCFTVCNKLGICLSFKHRLLVMDECMTETMEKAKRLTEACPLCHLVGDNCDIRIKPRHVSLDHQVQDCHFFGILLIFSRMAKELQALSDITPTLSDDGEHLKPENFVLTEIEQRRLLQSYKVIVGRVMLKHLPAFKWIQSCLPQHIPHRFQEQMAKKSSIIPIKLVMKNEAKLEDCVWILHETRQLLNNCFGGMCFYFIVSLSNCTSTVFAVLWFSLSFSLSKRFLIRETTVTQCVAVFHVFVVAVA